MSTLTASVDADWFKQQLELKRLSQRKLAKALGLDPSAITLTFKGQRRMQFDEAVQIARFIGQPLDQVLRAAGLPLDQDRTRRVPLAGIIGANNEIAARDMQRAIEAPPTIPDGTVALRVENPDSFLNGAFVFARLPEAVDPGAIGRTAIVQVRNGPMMLARVSPGSEPGRYDLAVGHGPAGASADGETMTRTAPPLHDVALTGASPVLWIKP